MYDLTAPQAENGHDGTETKRHTDMRPEAPGSPSASTVHERVHEIALWSIFEMLIPPSGFLNPSLDTGPSSPWACALRMKKSLTLVCKMWRQAILPSLYGEVSLRRIGQLQSFLDTFRTTNFASMVLSVSFAFYVPPNLERVAADGAASVLEICSNIKTLSFTSAFIRRPAIEPFIHLDPDDNGVVSAIRKLASDITAFEFCDSDHKAPNAPNILIMPLLVAFPNLVHLTISTTKDDVTADSTTALEFPKLESLCLWYHWAKAKPYLMTMAVWHLPSLKRVSIRVIDQLRHIWDGVGDHIGFFEAHGRRLETLDLGPCMRTDGVQLGRLLPLCPNLCHLVVPLNILNTYATIPKSVSLPPRVDVWDHESTVYSQAISLGITVDNRKFHYRLMDHGLIHIPELPHLLPFSAHISPPHKSKEPIRYPMGPPVVVHRMFGLCIVEVDWLIFRLDAADLSWFGRWVEQPQILQACLAMLSDYAPRHSYGIGEDSSDSSPNNLPAGTAPSRLELERRFRVFSDGRSTPPPRNESDDIECDSELEFDPDFTPDPLDLLEGGISSESDSTSESSDVSDFWQISQDEVSDLGWRFRGSEGYCLHTDDEAAFDVITE